MLEYKPLIRSFNFEMMAYSFFASLFSLSISFLYRKLTQADLDKMGIKQLPQYRDPYHDRNMKFGEIGCFLSHYNIWTDVSFILANNRRTKLLFCSPLFFAKMIIILQRSLRGWSDEHTLSDKAHKTPFSSNKTA